MPSPSSYISQDGVSSGAVVEYGRDNLTSYKTLKEISGPKWVLVLKSVAYLLLQCSQQENYTQNPCSIHWFVATIAF